MEKTNNSNNKSVVSWQNLLGFFIKNILKAIICCLIAVPCVFGIDYLFSGKDYDEKLEEWNSSYNLKNAKLDSLNIQLEYLITQSNNSLLYKLDPNKVAHTVSSYEVSSDNKSYMISENGKIVSEDDIRASKILALLNSSDLSSILVEDIPSDQLSDLVSFSVNSNFINVDILAESEEKALAWDKKIEAYIGGVNNVKKISSSTSVSFNKNLSEKFSDTNDSINDLSDQIIEAEKEVKDITEAKPSKYHLLRDSVLGLFAGFVISFLLFSYYPTISGKLCSSRDISLAAGAPSLGTVSLKGKKGLYNSVVGEKVFSSQEQENNYIKSCIKNYSSGKSSILFISHEPITQEEWLSDIAKTCDMKTTLVDNALLNPDFFSSLNDDQMVVFVAFDFKTTRQNISDVRTLLRTCGRDIEGVICVL